MIPEQLQNKGYRFVLLKSKNKIPFEKNWQNKGYKYNDKKLLDHISKGGNYGVIGGYGKLRIWDFDEVEFYNEIKDKLPKTLTIMSGSGGYHVYFISDYETNKVFSGKGELRCNNYQVVGPGSTHPNGNKYKVIRDFEIANIKKSDIEEIIKPYSEPKKIDNKVIVSDNDKYTRSEREMKEVCRLIAMNKSKEEVFEFMKAFSKWVESSDQYKELTYNKAFKYIETQRKDKDNLKTLKSNVLELLTAASRQNDKSVCQSLKNDAYELIIEYLLKNQKVYTIRSDKKEPEMYMYYKGIYIPNARTYIRELCMNILGKSYTAYIPNRIIERMEVKTYINEEDFFKVQNEYIVPVQNGLFNLKTKELMEFTPELIFTNKLPVRYEADASYEQIDNFFNEVLKNPETDIKAMQEWFGYCLVKNYKFHYATMFIGSGRNGKGVTLDLISSMLGSENISSVTLQKLENDRFSLSDLYNKYANISGDLSKTALKETGYFKQLTGQDSITVDRKYLSMITFHNYAKMMFATNKLPYSYDDSDGFYDRWLIFEFPHKFVPVVEDATYQKQRDEKLKEKLTTEEGLSGLFNWALIGLDRLLKNKGFSINVTTEHNRLQWKRQSSSFNAFFEDHCEIDFSEYTTVEILKLNYQKYCNIHKLKFESNMILKNILEQNGCEYSSKYEDFGDFHKTVRIWQGLKLKNLGVITNITFSQGFTP